MRCGLYYDGKLTDKVPATNKEAKATAAMQTKFHDKVKHPFQVKWFFCASETLKQIVKGAWQNAWSGAQLEHLKATTESKQVTFKIAYGLPLNEMLKWGLYISEPRRCGHIAT